MIQDLRCYAIGERGILLGKVKHQKEPDHVLVQLQCSYCTRMARRNDGDARVLHEFNTSGDVLSTITDSLQPMEIRKRDLSNGKAPR